MAALRSPHYNFVIVKTKGPICGREICIIWMTRSSHVQKWGERCSWHPESRQPGVPSMIWRKVWVYVSSTREKNACMLSHFSRVQLFVAPWTVALQAPLSMRFSRQEYWSGLPFTSPGDLSNPGIEPGSHALQADSLPSEPPGKPQPDRQVEVKSWRTLKDMIKSSELILREQEVLGRFKQENGTIWCIVWKDHSGYHEECIVSPCYSQQVGSRTPAGTKVLRCSISSYKMV